jgi:uncharacterized protein YjbK
MDQHLEIEFKNMLTEHEFQNLKQSFSLTDTDFIKQDNHYFDTSDFALKNLAAALRIRYKSGHYELTLKQTVYEGMLETNQAISETEAKQLIEGGSLPEGDIKQLLTALTINLDELQFFGTLSTNRAEIPYENGLLVLDHSFYLNTSDFEVEYEVTNKLKGQVVFENLLKQLNIPIRKTNNKIRRFYHAKQKTNELF